MEYIYMCLYNWWPYAQHHSVHEFDCTRKERSDNTLGDSLARSLLFLVIASDESDSAQPVVEGTDLAHTCQVPAMGEVLISNPPFPEKACSLKVTSQTVVQVKNLSRKSIKVEDSFLKLKWRYFGFFHWIMFLVDPNTYYTQWYKKLHPRIQLYPRIQFLTGNSERTSVPPARGG